jgi:hypothetical protein
VPTVAIVDGMLILLFFDDHDPPHFHVEFGEFRARVSIATATMLDGRLPVAKRRKLLEWTRDHREDLGRAWHDVRKGLKVQRIK